MKGSTETRRRPAIMDALAFCGEAALGMTGLFLLFCDIADDSPMVEGIGWLCALLVTKGAAMLVLCLCAELYKRYTGKPIGEE